MSLNRFRTLPPEVILLVLENLPDPAALLAAILSCHQVYDAVKPHIPSVLKSMPFSRISSLHANLHETSYILCEILRSVHPAPSDFRNLRDQAGFLTQTLVALERVVHHCNGDILALELPFQQCAMQCESIALQIVEKTTQPCDEKIIRGWVNMLSSYNMTFRVVLGKAKLENFSLTSDTLQQYQSIIKDTISDLKKQLESPIIAYYLFCSNTKEEVLWEKASIQRSLHICNGALEFTMTRDFQVHRKQPKVISSIKEFLPEERQGLIKPSHHSRQSPSS